MKKKLAAVLSAMMVLASATTALAAPSISAGDLSNSTGSVTKIESMTDAKAEEVANKLVIKADAIKTESENVTKVETKVVTPKVLKEAAKKAVEAVKSIFKVDITEEVEEGETKVTAAIVSIMDVKVEGEVSAEKPAKLTFDVPGAKAGENYIVLHQLASGDWETITPVVANGKITATFTSFSPVAIVKVAATATKTGVVSVLPVIALVGLAGTAVCGKKVKFN